MPQLHIVHVVGSADRSGAGVAASVCELCSAISGQARVTLVAGTDGGPRYPVADRVRQLLCPKSPWMGRYRRFAATLNQALAEGADLVHVHGLWMPEMHLACRAARKRNIPYLISAHGMLMPWAFQYKQWKKFLPWRCYQQSDLRRAAAVVANSASEASAIRAFGFPNETLTIPHGIHLPHRELLRNGIAPRQVVFLGRLHPIKGLMNLVDAWALVRPAGWQLVLAGPDEGGFQSILMDRIQQHKITESVSFAGALDDAHKWVLLQRADLAVLPSFTENFGLVVLEALACGVPVITTKGTPWAAVVERGCGWWVDVGVPSLAAVLREATGLSDQARQQMGRCGYELVRDAFTWDRVAREILANYERLKGIHHNPNLNPAPNPLRADSD